jgi:hypothetical protein
MGRADQLIKRIFREETPAATGQRVRFEVPAEIPHGALAPDGRLTRVVAPAEVAALPPPWCHLCDEALADFKMPGDHVGRAALARAELRRWARWVGRLEAAEQSGEVDAGADLHPRDVATWLVTPHRPRWLDAEVRRGALTVEAAGAGCWRLGPRDHEVIWIVANELPLRAELLPFLVVRSGRPLVDFAFWAETVKSPAWIAGVLQELPMAAELYEELYVPTDPEEQRRIHNEVLRRWLRLAPEAADEAIQKGIEQGLQPLRHQIERRLGRRLDAAEQAVLLRRFATVSGDRLGDIVLDLSADALAAWLADPDAR